MNEITPPSQGTGLRKQYPTTKYLIIFLVREVDLIFSERREHYYRLLEFIGNKVGSKAGVILPPNNAIEINFKYILRKDWKAQYSQISDCNPGILIIDTESVDDFDPNINLWVIISFQDLFDDQGNLQAKRSEDFAKQFTDCINNDQDLFSFIKQARIKKKINDLNDTMELKPEIFGCSIDVKKFLSLFF